MCVKRLFCSCFPVLSSVSVYSSERGRPRIQPDTEEVVVGVWRLSGSMAHLGQPAVSHPRELACVVCSVSRCEQFRGDRASGVGRSLSCNTLIAYAMHSCKGGNEGWIPQISCRTVAPAVQANSRAPAGLRRRLVLSLHVYRQLCSGEDDTRFNEITNCGYVGPWRSTSPFSTKGCMMNGADVSALGLGNAASVCA